MNHQSAGAFSRWIRSDGGHEVRLATAGGVMLLLGLGLAGSGLQLILSGDTDMTDLWSDTLTVIGGLLLAGGVAALFHRYLWFVIGSLGTAVAVGLYAFAEDHSNWMLLAGAVALAGVVISARSRFDPTSQSPGT